MNLTYNNKKKKILCYLANEFMGSNPAIFQNKISIWRSILPDTKFSLEKINEPKS